MDHVKNLSVKGYTLLRNYLDNSKLKELNLERDLVRSAVGNKSAGVPVGRQNIIKNDNSINNIHYHSNKYLDLAVNGLHIPIIQEFLNDPYYGIIPENYPNFILAQCNLRQSSTAIPYHVDVRLHFPASYGWSIQCIVALEDRHEFNGGLKVIPGSHLQDFGISKSLDTSNEEFVNLKAGECVIFFSHLQHGTTPVLQSYNSAWGLLLTYRAWWVKPQFDFVSMFGEERMSQMDNKQKTLLGFYSQPSKAYDGSPSARQGY